MKQFFSVVGLILLFFVASFVCCCLGFFHPFLWVYSSLTSAVLCAWPYCRLVDRHPHFGMAFLVVAVTTLLYWAMGEGDGLYLGIAAVIAVVAELVRLIGSYKSLTSKILSYAAVTLLPFANTLRMWIYPDVSMAQTVEEMGNEYAAQMPGVLSPWLLAAMIVASALLAIIMALVCYRKTAYQTMLDTCACPANNWFGTLMLKWGMNIGHRPLSRYAFGILSLTGNEQKLLDLGCGGGYNIGQMLTKSPKATVYGLDYSEKSVALSKQVNAKAVEAGRCIISQGDVAALPFEADSFDVVTAFETIYFWPDIQQCFNGVCRIVKPGGRFMVAGDSAQMASKWANGHSIMNVYASQQVADMMTVAGFSKVEINDNGMAMCVIGTK